LHFAAECGLIAVRAAEYLFKTGGHRGDPHRHPIINEGMQK
jgi:hypothetical protein